MKRVGKIKPQHKDLQWFGYKVTFLVPTPLPESPTREFSSLCQQAPLWRRKPYTPIYTPQLRHNLFTPSTQLLHTQSLLNHNTTSSHLSSQLSTSQQSSSQLSTSQLFFFTTNYLYLTTSIHNFYSQIYLVTILSHLYNVCTQQLDYIHKSIILHNLMLKEYSSLAL